jgi:hypothetical protein
VCPLAVVLLIQTICLLAETLQAAQVPIVTTGKLAPQMIQRVTLAKANNGRLHAVRIARAEQS